MRNNTDKTLDMLISVVHWIMVVGCGLIALAGPVRLIITSLAA